MSMPSRQFRVIEVVRSSGGSVAGRVLAALGHDVVKVELPGGDPRRLASTTPQGPVGVSFRTLNSQKRGIVLDSRIAEQRALLHELFDEADVAIVDFSPAQYEEWGVDEKSIQARWPHLIWASVTGFGMGDELASLPADALLAEVYGGMAALVGKRGLRPLQLGGEQAAYSAGFSALLGICLGLLRRVRGEGGDVVDVAMADVAALMDWKSEVAYVGDGVVNRRTDGNGWWRILPALDGWVGVLYDPEQFRRVAEFIDSPIIRDPRLADAEFRSATIDTWMPVIEEWVAARTMSDAYTTAQAHGLPWGFNCDARALLRVEQFTPHGFIRAENEVPVMNAPWKIDGTPWLSDPAPELGQHTMEVLSGLGSKSPRTDIFAPITDPLAGIIVLDFGTVTAGAAASRILADYGATVIKIEAADRPDTFRRWAASDGVPVLVDEANGVAPSFEANNFGKYGISLNLKDPADHARFLELVPRAHVLVENFRVGVTERLGIDCESLRRINPNLVYLSLGSQGQSGPESRFASYGSALDLLSGVASVTGYEDREPVWSSYELNYPDQIASLVGAVLVVYCLLEEIGGTHIDLSQRELMAWSIADVVAEGIAGGFLPEPVGNHRGIAVPHETYSVAGDDQWIAIVCTTDAQREALAHLIGGELAHLGIDADTWRQQENAVDSAVSAWAASCEPGQALIALRAAAVPAVPLLTSDKRSADDHFSHRRAFVTGPTGRRTKGYVFMSSQFTPVPARPAPKVGEHNQTVDEIIAAATKLAPARTVD